MSIDKDHECVFGEEQEPDGRLILVPCLECGIPAIEAIKHGKNIETCYNNLGVDFRRQCSQITDLQKLVEEQKGEIERLKVYPTAHVYDEHNKKVRILQSQLATQTERIKRLEEAIEEIRTYSEKYGLLMDSFHLGFIQGRCEQALTTFKERNK